MEEGLKHKACWGARVVGEEGSGNNGYLSEGRRAAVRQQSSPIEPSR